MEDESASKVLEAIRKDGKVKTAILTLVCACPNVVREYWGEPGGGAELLGSEAGELQVARAA